MCVCIVFSRESSATHCDRPSRTMNLTDVLSNYHHFAGWIIVGLYEDQSLQPPVTHPSVHGLVKRTIMHPLSALAPACRRALIWCITLFTDNVYTKLKDRYAAIAHQRLHRARLSLVGLHRSQRWTSMIADVVRPQRKRQRSSLGSLTDNNDW